MGITCRLGRRASEATFWDVLGNASPYLSILLFMHRQAVPGGTEELAGWEHQRPGWHLDSTDVLLVSIVLLLASSVCLM